MDPVQLGTGQIGGAQMETGSKQKVAPLECEVEPLKEVIWNKWTLGANGHLREMGTVACGHQKKWAPKHK